VLRWERAWHFVGQPFIDPAAYPPISVAMTGTHDTEALAAWWDAAPPAERAAALYLPRFPERGLTDPAEGWTARLRDVFLETAYHAGSDNVFFPIQDLFGWRDRINTPATVTSANWTWRLPWPVDRLQEEPEAAERARFCRALARASGRAGLH
jgi:4-alpha-glucanotransferase